MKPARRLAWAVLAVFFLPLIPEITGAKLLVFRDAFVTHFPVRLHAWSMLSSGRVPFVNFAASNGQPLLADPNSVALYPTMLLFAILRPAAAFNLHLLLHVVWAFFGAAALARRFRVSRGSSVLAGAAYAFSGAYLSYASAFTNSAAAAAWAPWIAAAAVDVAESAVRRSSRTPRALLALGIALGLQVLAGEPAVSAWTILFGAAAAAARLVEVRVPLRRWAPAAGGAAAAGALGAALAAPQIAATIQALPYSYRGEHAFSRAQFAASANAPARLLESFLPLVFGSPRPIAGGAFWGYRIFDSLQPYLYSVNMGLAAAVLVCAAFFCRTYRSSRSNALLAVVSAIFLILSFGARTPLLPALYGIPALRHLRYPIKFFLPFTLGLAVLVGRAGDTWREELRKKPLRIAAAAACAIPLAAALAVTAAPAAVMRVLSPEFRALAFPPDRMLRAIFSSVRLDAVLAVVAMGLLGAASARNRWNRPTVLTLAVLLGLLPSGWRLFVSAPTRSYRATPAIAPYLAGAGRTYVSPYLPEFAVARFGPRHSYRSDDVVELIETGHRELWPLTGVPDGVVYSYDGDPDGSYGFLDRVLYEAILDAPGPVKGRLLRLASVENVVSETPVPPGGFHARAETVISGRRIYLSRVDRPLPPVRCVSRIWRRPSLSGTVDLLKSPAFDPARDVVVRGPALDPAPSSAETALRPIEEGHFPLAVEAASSEPAVVVFSLTYFRYWRATVDGAKAPVEIANGSFCGVRVPPGRHVVRIAYDERPFRRGALLMLALAGAAVLLLRRSRKRPSRPGPEA